MSIKFTLPEFFLRYPTQPEEEEPEIHEEIEALAHAQQKIEHDLTRWQATKRYPKAVLYIGVIIWTMVMWGYESNAGGAVISIPQFRKDFGYEYQGEYVLDAKWQSAISAGPSGSVTVGFILGSYFSDTLGRRRALLIASLFSIPWITLEFVATTIEVFFVGKFMNGFALGVLASVCSTYVSEVSPLALRGLASSFLSLSMAVGPFICVLINNTTSTYTTRMAYRGIFIPQWIFAVLAFIMQCFIPESPYWLLSKDCKRDAMKNLERIFGPEDVQAQYALMVVTVEEAKLISAKGGSYADCFRRKDIRRTLLTAFAFSMQALSGVAYVASYSTYYFQLSGFDTQMSFTLACICQTLSICGVITTFFVIDRVGRRTMMLIGMVSLTICNLLVAATGMKTGNKMGMTASSAFMILYNYVYNIGMGPIPYILGNELSSVFLRAKTLSMGNALNNAIMTMWGSVLPYMFNPDQADMGSSINYIFTGLSFMSIFVFYFFLPETANRSFEEIDEMFALGIPARHWATYRTEKEAMADKAFVEIKGGEAAHEEDGEADHKENILMEKASAESLKV